jgi:hypothetical protein
VGKSRIENRPNRTLRRHACRRSARSSDTTTGLSVEALDFRLVRVDWRRRLTLAVSNPLGDVQREYRRNGYAEVKSH